MSDNLVFQVTLQVLAGIALAACCGLRAFLPPLMIGLALRFQLVDLVLGRHLELNQGFEWLGSTAALIVFGVATVLEILADKVPIVDHLLDIVQTAVRPLAGALVFAASLTHLGPLPAALTGLIAGGGTATGVHLLKSKIRLLSTLGTGGLASPLLSLFEDVLALFGTLLAILSAILAAIAVLIGLVLTFVLLRGYLKRTRRLSTA